MAKLISFDMDGTLEAGDPPGPAAAVRGRAGGGNILLEQGLGLEFGIDGKPRPGVGDGRFLGRGMGCGMG